MLKPLIKFNKFSRRVALEHTTRLKYRHSRINSRLKHLNSTLFAMNQSYFSFVTPYYHNLLLFIQDSNKKKILSRKKQIKTSIFSNSTTHVKVIRKMHKTIETTQNASFLSKKILIQNK